METWTQILYNNTLFMFRYLSTQLYIICNRTLQLKISYSLFSHIIYITKRIPNAQSLSAILVYHIPKKISLISYCCKGRIIWVCTLLISNLFVSGILISYGFRIFPLLMTALDVYKTQYFFMKLGKNFFIKNIIY